MEPVSAFSAITKAIDAVKALRDFEKKFDAAQFKLQLAELMEALADAKMSTLSLQEALQEKDSEISRLRANFERKSKTIEYDGFRYELDEQGRPFGYPFCNRCMTVDGILIKVERVPMAPGMGKVTKCPQCNSAYQTYKAEAIMDRITGKADEASES